MVFPTALLAARPNSSQNAPGMAFLAWTRQSFVCLTPSFLPLFSNEESAAWLVFLHTGNQLGEFGALKFLPSRIPFSTRVHASGPNRRPAARRRSASTASPLRGLGTSQNKFERPRPRTPLKLLPGPIKKALLGTWEPGPLARYAKGDPSSLRE